MSEPNPRVDRWNERFARLAADELSQPDALLEVATAGIAPGRALDLACGAGRHAIALALRGYRVTAVDFADVGLGLMLERARRLGCSDSIDARHVLSSSYQLDWAWGEAGKPSKRTGRLS